MLTKDVLERGAAPAVVVACPPSPSNSEYQSSSRLKVLGEFKFIRSYYMNSCLIDSPIGNSQQWLIFFESHCGGRAVPNYVEFGTATKREAEHQRLQLALGSTADESHATVRHFLPAQDAVVRAAGLRARRAGARYARVKMDSPHRLGPCLPRDRPPQLQSLAEWYQYADPVTGVSESST
ncbi:uncharacterized protein KRP23_4102 [Phytophthora ramorum]|uniref:uncharacterized protein n=1 Tax=Phytophthora ramorum TaxID=164328 RepID=UPI0030AF9E63|nr:hypothetical protein KRP23_4102 [Phytophthora ramorum]